MNVWIRCSSSWNVKDRYLISIKSEAYKWVYTVSAWAFQVGQWSRICLPMQEIQEMGTTSLGQEDPVEEEMASRSSIPGLENSTDRATWRATVHGVAKSQPWLHAHTHTRTEKIWRVAVYLKEPGGPPGPVKERQVQPVPDRVSPPGGWRRIRRRNERTGIVFPVWRKKREAVPEAEGLEAEKADVKGLQGLLRSVGFISGTMGSN